MVPDRTKFGDLHLAGAEPGHRDYGWVWKWMLGFCLALWARGAGEEVRGVEPGHQNLRVRLGLGAGVAARRAVMASRSEVAGDPDSGRRREGRACGRSCTGAEGTAENGRARNTPSPPRAERAGGEGCRARRRCSPSARWTRSSCGGGPLRRP